ncbi:hypothetical protein AbHV_ORF44 [Abalone herpesvirus Victoria/AUS/2009]|uniref:Uncharacterized protein n=1 Tax=Abalone herpesvirus (isolate Abalone/Australia/Victoria/2009) TaxID=1241371 RepID=K4JUH0_ABHV|nr:hypothetical protein AbHV_ORF44 [Abalone herpesvirus Victoria/AUS/2009]AFU90054.1 hypothetical protein AbHV_ORF44 [Abalone herpesvirus Victoria/AUS/2009]
MAKRQADTAFSAEISHEDIFKQLVAFHHYEMDIKSLDFKFGGTKKKPFCLIEFYSGKDLVDTLPKLESRVEVVAKVGERMLICKEPAEKMSNRDVVKLIRHSRFKMSYGKDKVDGLDWSRVDLSGMELMNGFEMGVQEPPVKKARGSLKEEWRGFNTLKCETKEDARKILNFLIMKHQVKSVWIDDVTRDGTIHFVVKEGEKVKITNFVTPVKEVKKNTHEKNDESSNHVRDKSIFDQMKLSLRNNEVSADVSSNEIDESLLRLRNHVSKLKVSIPQDETAPLFDFFLLACAKTASLGLEECYIVLHGEIFINFLKVSDTNLTPYMAKMKERVNEIILIPSHNIIGKLSYNRIMIINPISFKPTGKNVLLVKRSQLLKVIKSSGIVSASNFIEAMTQLLDASIMDTMGMVVKGSYVDPDSAAVVPSTSSTPDPAQQETFQSALVPVVQMINQTFDTFLDKLEMRRVQERKEEQICRERENEARRKEEETRRKEEREEIERIRQEDIRRADEQRKQDMEQRVMEMKLDAEQRDREIKRQTEKHEREIQIQVQQREREFQMKMKAEAEQREREAEQRERELKLQAEQREREAEQRERELKLQAEQREREGEQRERELKLQTEQREREMKLQAEQRERDQIREEQRMQLLIKLMKESKQGPTTARPPADRVMYSESSKIVTDVVAFFADQTDETILHFKRTSKGLMGMRKNFLRSGKKEGVGSLLFLSSGKISTEELMTAIKKTNIISSSHNKVSTNNKADFFVELKRGLAYEKTWTPGQSEGFTAGDNQLINTL